MTPTVTNTLVAKVLAAAGVMFALDATPVAATPRDTAAIEAAGHRMLEAMRSKNVDAIMANFAPDVVVYDASPPRQYVGAPAFRKNWLDFLASVSGPWTVDYVDGHAFADGTLGYAYHVVHFVGSAANGDKVDFTDRLTDVYRKIHGRWLIVHEHTSFPVDFATAKADLESAP